MTLDEYREEKKFLEEKILILITDFQRLTGALVVGVDLSVDRTQSLNEPVRSVVYDVELGAII